MEPEKSESDFSVEAGGFSVKDVPADVGEVTDSDLFWDAEDTGAPEPVVSDSQVNAMLLDTVFVMLSKLAVVLTGFEEVGLDDDEIKQLVKLWEPFVPGMSPFANAVMGTALIVSSKTFLYLHLRRKSRLSENGNVPKGEVQADVQVV